MNKPLLFEDCVIVDEILYFFDADLNALYSYEYEKKNLKLLSSIPDENYFAQRLIGKILYYRDELILIPMRTQSAKVWFYNIKKYEWNYINIEEVNIIPPFEKIATAYIYDDILILVGCYYAGIVLIDLNDMTPTYFSDEFKEKNTIWSLFSCCLNEGKLYIPSPQKNEVYIFDIVSRFGRWIKVGDSGDSFSGILRSGENFYLSPYKGTHLVKWDGGNKYSCLDIMPEFISDTKYLFRGIGRYGNNVVVNGIEGMNSFSFNPKDWRIQNKIEESYIICKEIDYETYICQNYQGEVHLCVNSKEEEFNLELKNEDILSILPKENRNYEYIIQENEFIDAKLFVEMLKRLIN